MVSFLSIEGGSPRNYFILQRSILLTLGISLDQSESHWYKLYTAVVFICGVSCFIAIEIREAFLYIDNLDVLSNILSHLVTHILGFVKILWLYVYRKKVGVVLDSLEKGDFAPNTSRGGDKEEVWIKECILFTTRQSMVYWVTLTVVFSIGLISSILSRVQNEDHEKWMFAFLPMSMINVTYSPNFEIAWAYQIANISLIAALITSTDLIIVGVMAHIAVQCRILQNAVRRMVMNAYKLWNKDQNYILVLRSSEQVPVDIVASIPWKYLHAILKETVIYQLSIVDVAYQFEELFNILVLTVFVTTLFILCFIMYHSSLSPLLSSSCLQDLTYVMLIIVQILMYCYWGNQVNLESQAVAQAIFETSFVGSDPKFQKGLALMILRSQRPIVLTAGKFTKISLQTFIWIIRGSYSYYMVLHKHNAEVSSSKHN